MKILETDTAYFISYLTNVLEPAEREFLSKVEENKVQLHHVFSFNAILAHAIDYMVFIANKEKKVFRSALVLDFDNKYYVEGSVHINNKFQLLDAVNNSFKHVELDQKRYKELIEIYGELSFHCLKEESGKVFFSMPNFRFDYCRVVLRPIAAIFTCGLEKHEDVIDFINGDICGALAYGDFDYEPHDAIDRMIDHCNPQCMDCGEYGDDCDCSEFVFGDVTGEFNPDRDPNFDFDDVMSQISSN
ncbi:hypothetical protein [Aliivibrio fischeri]|uniref:hypothetical protein n=1 Tax=Aliivibrio fischeri TaxID=668 RepID=UPI0009081D4B|nr:hypothetical protein [Aliivibrio fischeri]